MHYTCYKTTEVKENMTIDDYEKKLNFSRTQGRVRLK